MKCTKIALAIAFSASIGMAAAASAATSGGTITFTGAVTDSTCPVTGGAGTDGGTGNFTVALDPIAATRLAAAGDVGNAKLFQVLVGGPGQGDCVAKTATMSFNTASPRVDTANGALLNALGSGAKFTDIQLLQKDLTTAIDLRDPAESVGPVNFTNNTAQIWLGAQYLATGAATSGLVSTKVQYSVVYN